MPFLQERIGKTGFIDAVDIAETMSAVARGQNSAEKVTFIHGDILVLPNQTEHYHQLLCYSVSPHFPEQGGGWRFSAAT